LRAHGRARQAQPVSIAFLLLSLFFKIIEHLPTPALPQSGSIPQNIGIGRCGEYRELCVASLIIPRQARDKSSATRTSIGVCWKKSELILNKIPNDRLASLAGRSGGAGIPFPPTPFPSRPALAFSPPQFFVPTKLARRLKHLNYNKN